MRRTFWTLLSLFAALLAPSGAREASISQDLAITVTAVTQTVGVSPTSLTFVSQNRGTAQTTTKTNPRNVSFPLSSMAMTGANAGDFSETNNCPTPLAVGTSCYINVVFTPTAVGTRTASVVVSATGGGTYTVPLSGTGVKASNLIVSGPIVINGQTGTVISGMKISSTSGDCVEVVNSTNVTIKNSEIGPCGTNNTTSPSRGIYVSGGTGNNIFDNYIHVENQASGCCDSHDNIQANGTTYLSIQGNVIAYGETNIEINGAPNDHISVIGNFLLNPLNASSRGQNVQSWASSHSSPNTNIAVNNNYTLASLDTSKYLYPENQEDSLNFGFTNGVTAQNNYVAGGHSGSGCGIIADEAANSVQFLNNILSDTGQCGIGIASGTNQTVSANIILNLNPVNGAGNTALYVWNQYSDLCGPVTISNNVADEVKPDRTHSGYWNGGGCGTPTLINNTFHLAAHNLIFPMTTTNSPPPVPVQPKNCVAVSPYTTNTSLQPCWTQ